MRYQRATAQTESTQILRGRSISHGVASFVSPEHRSLTDLALPVWQIWESKCLRLSRFLKFLPLILCLGVNFEAIAQNQDESHAKIEDLFGETSPAETAFEGIDLSDLQKAKQKQGKSGISNQERAVYEAAVLEEAAKIKHLMVSGNRNEILKLVACLMPKEQALKFQWQDDQSPAAASNRFLYGFLLTGIYSDPKLMKDCDNQIEGLRENIKPAWFAMVRQLALYTFTTGRNRQLAFLKIKSALNRTLRCKNASATGCQRQDYAQDSFLPAKVGSPLNEMEAFGEEEWQIGLFDFAVFNSDLKPADWNFLYHGKMGPIGLKEWLKTSCGSDERGNSRIRERYDALMEAENLKRTEFNSQNPAAVPLKLFKADALPIEDICGLLNLNYDSQKSVFYWDAPKLGRLSPAEAMMLLDIWANGAPFDGNQKGGAAERDLYAYKRIIGEALRPLSLQTREHEAIRSAKALFIDTPYAAIATNVNPSNAQLQTVVLYMLERAQKAVSEHESFILRMSSGDLARREVLKLVAPQKIVQAVLKFKEGKDSFLFPFRNQVDFEGDIIPKMQKEQAYWELGVSGIEMSIIVAGNLVCIAPWGKLLSWTARSVKLARLTMFAMRAQRVDQIWNFAKGFASPVCINGFNLGVGVYYARQSYTEYMSMYNSIYSTIVNEGSVYGIDDLTMQEKWLMIDAMSIFSGTTFLKVVMNKFGSRISMENLTNLARRGDQLKRLVPQAQ